VLFNYRPWLRNTFFRIGAKNEAKCKTFDGLVQYGQQYLDPEGQYTRVFALVEPKPKQLTAQLAKALAPPRSAAPATRSAAPPKGRTPAAAAVAPKAPAK